jgi:hypothetical protein
MNTVIMGALGSIKKATMAYNSSYIIATIIVPIVSNLEINFKLKD